MLSRRRLIAGSAVACAVVGLVVFAPGGASQAAIAPGITERVSVGDGDPGAQQARQASEQQAISGNGRYVAFTSDDESLSTAGPGLACENSEGPCYGIFVRDRLSHHTDLVSIGYENADTSPPKKVVRPANGESSLPSISDDGRYVSFVTQANNVAPAPVRQGGSTVVVCDRGKPKANGQFAPPPKADEDYPSAFTCVAAARTYSTIDEDGWPRLSAAGNRVVWSELYQGYTSQAFWADVRSSTNGGYGPLHSPTAVNTLSVTLDALPFELNQPAISADGNWVVAAGRDNADNPGSTPAIVEINLGTGASTRIDYALDPTDPARWIGSSDTAVGHPAVSGDGRVVVFDADLEFNPQVYAVDTTVPVSTRRSVLVSRDVTGGDQGDGGFPTISADARYVAFLTDKSNMHEGILNTTSYSNCFPYRTSFAGRAANRAPAAAPAATTYGACQVVVRDIVADAARAAAGQGYLPAQLASGTVHTPNCDYPGNPSTGPSGGATGAPTAPATSTGSPAPADVECASDDDSSGTPSLSSDGADVSFVSAADDLVSGDTNGYRPYYNGYGPDVFVRTWTPKISGSIPPFGGVQVGSSSTQGLTLTVNGFGPVSIGDVSIGGTNPGDFTVGTDACSGTSLHETDPCTVMVTFTPAATGTRTGTVIVGNDGADPGDTSAVLTVPVTGNGSKTPPKNPQFSTTPSIVDFGASLPLDVPGKTKPLTITNPGGSPLSVTNVQVQDSTNPGSTVDYTVDFSDCVGGVPAQGSCTVAVTFIGHAVGQRDAVLVVTDDAAGGPHMISLVANVPKPTVTANPGVSPPGRVTSIGGTGFAPSREVDIALIGSNETTTATADKHGEFEVPLVLFPRGILGPRTVTARTHGVSPTISAEGPFLIALGSITSPEMGIRH